MTGQSSARLHPKRRHKSRLQRVHVVLARARECRWKNVDDSLSFSIKIHGRLPSFSKNTVIPFLVVAGKSAEDSKGLIRCSSRSWQFSQVDRENPFETFPPFQHPPLVRILITPRTAQSLLVTIIQPFRSTLAPSLAETALSPLLRDEFKMKRKGVHVDDGEAGIVENWTQDSLDIRKDAGCRSQERTNKFEGIAFPFVRWVASDGAEDRVVFRWSSLQGRDGRRRGSRVGSYWLLIGRPATNSLNYRLYFLASPPSTSTSCSTTFSSTCLHLLAFSLRLFLCLVFFARLFSPPAFSYASPFFLFLSFSFLCCSLVSLRPFSFCLFPSFHPLLAKREPWKLWEKFRRLNYME